MGDLFASIKGGLEEAIAHQKGEKAGIRLFTPEEVNVKHVREKTGLTQEQFAATFGISLGTLRHWERGDRRPHGPASQRRRKGARYRASDIDRGKGC